MLGESYGWVGATAWIDLTRSKVTFEPTKKYADRFIGGSGVGQYILFKELEANVGPLDQDNIIVFGTGPLTGTMAPASSRLSINTKNVLTGGTNRTNLGGYFAPEVKFSGFDFIIVKGRADRPIYIWINDGQVEIKDASYIWGKTTWKTEEIIREKLKDKRIRVLSIGPAGENLVKGACVIGDNNRAAGRGGVGCVMGSKKLKAIAARGTGYIEVADPDGFMEEVDKFWAKFLSSPTIQRYMKLGIQTSGLTKFGEDKGLKSSRNFQDIFWDSNKIEAIHHTKFENYITRKLSCFNCPAHGDRFYEIVDGPFAGLKTGAFKLNLVYDYAQKLDISDPEALIYINALCNQLGIDIDNSSGAIAWAFEAFQRDILTEKDTEGLTLRWGDYNTVIELIKKTVALKGFGRILAEGAKGASEIIGRGSQKFAIHIKGQDLIEELRDGVGWALGNVVAPSAGGHCPGGAPFSEFEGVSQDTSKVRFGVSTAGDPRAYQGKAKLVCWFEAFKEVIDMMGVCYFVSVWNDAVNLPGPEDYSKIFAKATGNYLPPSQLMKIGEQVFNIEKAFNTLHRGFTRKDDHPPDRMMKEGSLLEREKWEKMLDEYYELHRWDKKTGWQTEEGLQKLGLHEVIDKLKKAGRL